MKKKLIAFIIIIILSLTACTQKVQTVPDNKNISKEDNEIKQEGVYVGQADSNFIEVKIIDEKGNENFRVFGMVDSIKKKFSELKLEEGNLISFNYMEQEVGNPIIVNITKIAETNN